MPPQSWLPEGGENLFQRIKAQRDAAQAAGIKILNLAIGQPPGPALLSARMAAAEAVMSDAESMHEYQDNGSPGAPGFAREFVEFHTGKLPDSVTVLPIPGIKPMLGLIPLACNCQAAGGTLRVYTTTDPGYPTPADWCRNYLGVVGHRHLRLGPENNFRFSLARILEMERIPASVKILIMMNYPHNPSGQIAIRSWLWELCRICEANGFRLFNDAAYIGLAHSSECCSLAQVAVEFSELSWMEAYSASKLIGNGTGWRIGAMVGSPDFIADIARVKGNTDSGFAAPMAAGVLAAIVHDRAGIEAYRVRYGRRIEILINILHSKNMQLAVMPGAGFFTLWLAPDFAFGQPVKRSGEKFNDLMIERTGVVGVPFGPYIRYAVVGDIAAMAQEISHAFSQANVGYEVKIV